MKIVAINTGIVSCMVVMILPLSILAATALFIRQQELPA